MLDETHKQVVQRIKAVPNETRLLVIDPAGQVYYNERDIIIKSSMANVRVIKTPAQPPVTSNNRPNKLDLNDSTVVQHVKSHSPLKVHHEE